jgi:hypothetical protein
MIISDLYAAGSGHGARLTEFPGRPGEDEATRRLEEAIPHLPRIANTSSFWGVRIILSELYNWHEPITSENWRRLDRKIRERASDREWGRTILDRAGIHRSGTELARRGNGDDDDRLVYALEWAFFTRCQWGEFDTALYELERVWGRSPESPTPIGSATRPPTEHTIRSIDDVHSALDHYVSAIPFERILATATHFSTDISYRPVSDAEMTAALARRDHAVPTERDCFASYINEHLLTRLEKVAADRFVFQFSLGAEPLPFETASRLSQRTIAELAEMIGRYPGLRFQCFLASRHANQSLCTLARELPNFSLAGCWWHNVFPDVARQVLSERLDMLPSNKQVAFFSDAYCAEWCFAKARILRRVLAEVLAERIDRGQLNRTEARDVARSILYETPQSLLGFRPRAMN